ncbi:acetyl-CoA carboxylase biotin carboxyl carrier protein [Amedibacillus sp. YH-ame6]
MNTENIKDIIKVFEDSKLAKMELEIDDMKIKMEKAVGNAPVQEYMIPAPQPMPSVAQTPVESAPVKEEMSGYWVKAPIVGTFYNSRAQGSAPYIEIGQHVKKGDTLCIIEAMKVMNEIHSPMDGIIQEILVTNDAMVEFDQDLIRIGEAHD